MELVIQPEVKLKLQLLTIIGKMLASQKLTHDELCVVIANSGQVDSLMNDIEPHMRLAK
jgi:hypothetical protein